MYDLNVNLQVSSKTSFDVASIYQTKNKYNSNCGLRDSLHCDCYQKQMSFKDEERYSKKVIKNSFVK
jgi:hypothetical protein